MARKKARAAARQQSKPRLSDQTKAKGKLTTASEIDETTDRFRRLVLTGEFDRLIEELSDRFSSETVAKPGSSERSLWLWRGKELVEADRPYGALLVFKALHHQILKAEKRAHKGHVLYDLGVCREKLNHRHLMQKYFMLALCEDAVTHEGKLHELGSGCYQKLVYEYGMARSVFEHYYARAWEEWQNSVSEAPHARFAESILQRLDSGWMTINPSLEELGVYDINTEYLRFLISMLGDTTGQALEWIAEYVLNTMPGCRTYRRLIAKSTDYDVVGVFDGARNDFRSEFGRYVLCECKDWNRPADVTTMVKFAHFLDMIDSRFGILFSKNGISGAKRTTDAAREQIKIFQKRGVVITVVTEKDLLKLADGFSFISMLRSKYEAVRLDVAGVL